MKPMPKCSLFKFISSDMVTNVTFAEVSTLPSAYSSFIYMKTERESVSSRESGVSV